MFVTGPSSASLPASAKAPWSCSSCTSIWRRSNDALHTKETRMTEVSARSPAEVLVTKLRAIQVFADLPQDDLLWFVAQCSEHHAVAGEIIGREGQQADSMLSMPEGEMRARSEHGDPDGPVFTVRSGEVTGLLPFSRLKIMTITGRAVLPTHYLMFPASNFPELFHRMPELTRRLVGLLADRIREVTRTEQQREKLASLGKLSAGLAHELNNPSAAARRSAAALRDCLARLRAAARSTKIGPDDCAKLAQTEEEIRSSLTPPNPRTNLHASNAKRPSNPGSNRTTSPRPGSLLRTSPMPISSTPISRVSPRLPARPSAPNSLALQRSWKWIASPRNLRTARRASPILSGPSKNIPIWIKAPCKRWTSSTVSKTRSRSCITS